MNGEIDSRLLQMKARFIVDKGVYWFFRLRKNDRKTDTGLVGYYGEEMLRESRGIIIARDAQGKRKPYKQYAWFESIDSFIKYIDKVPQEDRHFYELIGGTSREQKPYFDLDIDGTLPTSLLQTTIEEIISLFFKTFGVILEKNNISVYTTKYPIAEGQTVPKKYSYHLVVQGYYFANHEEMRKFGQELIKIIDSKIGVKFVDDIWHSSRQFRLLGSSKLESGSRKQLENKTNHSREEFLKSFVTNIDSCILLSK